MATTVSLKPNAVELSGSTSGTTTLQATAVAGTTTITLPAATDTLVGKATTDTLTNKTLTSPTLTTPVLGTPSSGTLTNCTGLPNAGLVNSSVTIGGTSIALGASSSTITNDLSISGLTVGKGGGSVSTNTAVGASALAANTTAANSTAVGYQAGNSNSTGDDLNAFGYQSFATSTGGANSGFGSRSGRLTTTGTRNSAFGYYSFYTNTTGSYNTAIGDSALYYNTTASNNTAVGYQAGYSNTTGTRCVFIGDSSGYSVTTSNRNVMVGKSAGFNTTGAQNTFIGDDAGVSVTSGANNVIVGRYTGNNGGLDIRTASNYIVLSDGDGNPLISTNSTRSVALNGATPQTGTGITFPATQSASSDANTLDDYEEGTWTPNDASGAGLSLTVSSARYTKIGNLVYVYMFVTFPTTSSSANVTIGGLPFTSVNASAINFGLLGRNQSGTNTFNGQIAGNSTTINAVQPQNFSGTAVPNSTLSTLGLIFAGSYQSS